MMKYSFNILMIILVAVTVNGAQSDVLFSDVNLLNAVKNNSSNQHAKLILGIANENLDSKIKTITSVESTMGPEYKHDYFSEGPYWWPNPENPDGSYIRHDGKRNPDRFVEHKNLHMKFYRALTSLAISAWMTGEKKYAERAEEFINAWWINPETKMAPHLKYAQMIRNKNTIRGVGIIETHRYVGLIESLILLKSTGMLNPATIEGMDKWWNEYYTWLTESEWGIDEEERGNNHSSWWAAQAATIAEYLGKREDLKKYFEYGKHFLVDRQITEDCEQPLEDERTLSLNYNVFNLDALSFLASVLYKQNYDLFNYEGNGCTIVGAASRITSFVLEPDTWELEQIKPHHSSAKPFMAMIGFRTGNKKFLSDYKKLTKDSVRDKSYDYTDPFFILLDAQIDEIKFD